MRGCRVLLLLLLPGGLQPLPSCDRALQRSYCKAWYGGDYHTACRYCGRGALCPKGSVTGRGITSSSIRGEILRRHNEYREDVRSGKVGGMPETKMACLPPLSWDSELAEVAQVWADQCSMINYPGKGMSGFPRVFHEKSRQRSTSKFHHPPGVGQNVAWALTQDINFTQIIDDLWYRDIRSLRPGVMDDFRVSAATEAGSNVITQMLWGHTTHIGCGWLQIDVGDGRFAYPGRYENFFVCNYGVGGNVPGQPVYQHPDCLPQPDANSTVGADGQSVIGTNSSSQVFPNFSVSTRTVIAACLQAIECVKMSGEGEPQCSDLSEICHNRGPDPQPTSGLISVLDLECRVEHILCHAMDTSADSTKCKNAMSACLRGAPGTRPLQQHQGVTGVMAMLGLATSELPPTFPLPQTTPVPTVGSASLDELTTIGPDFRLTTSTSAPDIGGSDEVDYVTEQNGGEEKSPATAGTPTFFPTESQASTSPSSPSLSTLPDERSSVAERGSTPDSSAGYERETQTLDERSEDKGGQEETETEGTIEDSFAKETQRESFVTEEYLNNDLTTESSDIAEPSTKGSSFGENPPESFLNVITTDSSVPSTTTKPEESTAKIPIDSSITISPTSKDMSIESTTDEFTDTEDTNGKDTSSQRDTGPSTVFVIEDSATTEFNVVQVSREELSDANVVTTTRPGTTGQTAGNNFQDESTDSSDAFTTRPIDNGASGVRSEESGEEMVGRESEPVGESPSSQTTESDASGESASAPPDQSSSSGAEKIGIIHETAIDTSGNALSVEDLTNLLKNKSLVFNPEDVDFDGLSEEFGNDTLIIIEDILVDSNGRVINSTATTNLADGILPNGLDSNLLNTVENVLDGQNDQDQNSQTVNAGERHKGKAKEEGDQIAGSDHRGNSGTDKGEVEIDDDAGPSQSSIRPEIDAGGTAIPPNPATGTENLPADPTGRPERENEDNAVDRVPEDIPIKGIIRPEASSEDHAVNTFDPDTNLSAGAAGESNVMGERQRDEPGADEGDVPTTAATTSGQESDGPDAAAGGKSSGNQEGVADQQKNEEDAENYSSDQVTRPSVPTDYTLNDGSDQTTTETSTNPATPVSRKVEDDDLEESIPSMVPGLKEEDVDFEEQEEECFRRYTEARRTVDISYYNTTVRTRLLTAICLEGIRCEPGQDSTRCQFLHSKCNQQVDTSRLSFGMRVTLSECTVEDVLCHLGHRTPVMCCQDRYSECVETLSHGHQISEEEQRPLIYSQSSPIHLNQSGLIDSLATQIFLANGSVLSTDATGLADGWPDADNETLSIFQDFLVILDDPAKLNETLLSGDSTIENIIDNIRTNDSDFQIIFDPENIMFQGPGGQFLDPDNLDPEEVSILDQIKSQINKAAESVAERCSTNVCFQSVAEEQPATDVQVVSKGVGQGAGLILVEPKSDLAYRLGLCQAASNCADPVTTCLFAQARCLQLSGTDKLQPGTRRGLVGCRTEAIQCSLVAESATSQAACAEQFQRCAASLGVKVSGNAVRPSDTTENNVDLELIEETTTPRSQLEREKMDDVLVSSPGNFDDEITSKKRDDPENNNVRPPPSTEPTSLTEKAAINDQQGQNVDSDSSEISVDQPDGLEVIMTAEVVTENKDDTSGAPTKATPAGFGDMSTEDDNEDVITGGTPTGQPQEVSSVVKEDYNARDGEGQEMAAGDIGSESSSTPPTQNGLDATPLMEKGTEAESNGDSQESSEKEEDPEFQMNLPGLGMIITTKENDEATASDNTNKPTNSDDSWDGMSLPPFGFNVTVDKEPTQCLVGATIYNDFEQVPNDDPCRRCNCEAGQVQCYTLQCPTPPPGCQRSRRPRQRQNTCCPEYQCPEGSGHQGSIPDQVVDRNQPERSNTEDFSDQEKQTTGNYIDGQLNQGSQTEDGSGTFETTTFQFGGDISQKDKPDETQNVSREDVSDAVDIMTKVTDTIMDIFKETTDEFQKINQASLEKESTKFETIDETTQLPTEDQLPVSNVSEADGGTIGTEDKEDKRKKGGAEEEVNGSVTSDGSIADEARRPTVKPNSSAVKPQIGDKSSSKPPTTPAQSPNSDVTRDGETTPPVSRKATTELPGIYEERDPEMSNTVSGDVKESVTSRPQLGIFENSDAVSSADNTQDTKESDTGVKIPAEDETDSELASIRPGIDANSSANKGNVDANKPANKNGSADRETGEKADTTTMSVLTGNSQQETSTPENRLDQGNSKNQPADTSQDGVVDGSLATSKESDTHVNLESDEPLSNSSDTDVVKDGQKVTDHKDKTGEKKHVDSADEEDLSVNIPFDHVIGDKDVKVFLNFSWSDGTVPTAESDTRNLTGKIMKALNAGVGYLIVPDGEEHEEEEENTVNLVQTILLDYDGNLRINTTIPKSPTSKLSPNDLDYIQKVEQKTSKIIQDIFNQMENDLESEVVDVEYEEYGEKQPTRQTETIEVTTKASNIDKGVVEVDEAQETKSEEEVIKLVVSLHLEGRQNVRDSSEFLLLSGPLVPELEKATGLKTVVVDKQELGSLLVNDGDLLLQVDISKRGGINIDIATNEVSEDGEEDMEEKGRIAENIIREGLKERNYSLIVSLDFEDEEEEQALVSLYDTLTKELEKATGLVTMVVPKSKLNSVEVGEEDIIVQVVISTGGGEIRTDTLQNQPDQDSPDNKDELLTQAVNIIRNKIELQRENNLGDSSVDEKKDLTNDKTNTTLFVDLMFEDEDPDMKVLLSDTLSTRLQDATDLKPIVTIKPDVNTLPVSDEDITLEVSISKEGQISTDISQNGDVVDDTKDIDQDLVKAVEIIEEEIKIALDSIDQARTESNLANMDTTTPSDKAASPTLIISFEFEDLDADPKPQSYFDSVVADVEIATGMTTVAVLKPDLRKEPKTAQDTIVEVFVAGDGQIDSDFSQIGTLQDPNRTLTAIVEIIREKENEKMKDNTKDDGPISTIKPDFDIEEPTTQSFSEIQYDDVGDFEAEADIGEDLTEPATTDVVVVNVIAKWEGGEDEEMLIKEQLRQFVEEESGLKVFTEDLAELEGPAYYVELKDLGSGTAKADIFYNATKLEDLDSGRQVKAKLVRDLVLRGWASLTSNDESSTASTVTNIPGKGQLEFGQPTSTVKSFGDDEGTTTTQETVFDDDLEETTPGKGTQDIGGKKKPLLIVSVDFDDSLPEQISDQFFDKSIISEAEVATGLKTIFTTKERLTNLADDDSDIILEAEVGSGGEITLVSGQQDTNVDEADNLDEITLQITNILNKRAEETFRESMTPLTIELPNIKDDGLVVTTTEDSSKLGFGEFLVVNVLGDLPADDQEVETAKSALRKYVRRRSGLKVYTEDSEEVVGPAYYVELYVGGQEVEKANIFFNTSVLKDMEPERRQEAEQIRNLVIEAWENGVQLEFVRDQENTDEAGLIIVNLNLLDRGFSKNREDALKSAVKAELEEKTGYRTDVVTDSVDFEVEEGVERFFYKLVSVGVRGEVVGRKPINELPPGDLDKATLDSLILDAVENGLKEIGNEVDNDATDSDSRVPPTRRPVTVTPVRRPGVSGGQYDRIIEILANLFIRTLDLSISIKGAMDRKSEEAGKPENESDNVEFKIVSTRKKQTADGEEGLNAFESGDGIDLFLPELIRITPTDAMFVNASDETGEVEKKDRKPVVIDVVTDQSVRFNVPDGMILEIDLSDLPADQGAREQEIRNRVRNLIREITSDGNDANIVDAERDALSDAIIKNITQIVMVQMDEALRVQSNSTLLIESGGSDEPEKPFSIPDVINSIFDIVQPTTNQPATTGADLNVLTSRPEFTSRATNKLGDDEEKGGESSLSTTNPLITAATTPGSVLTDIEESQSEVLSSIKPVSVTTSSTTVKSVTPPSSTPADVRPTSEVQPEQVNNVINNVKKTISEIIKDVLEGANDDTNTDDILESIVSRVPPGIKIMTAGLNGEDLRKQVTKSVSDILSEKAADQVKSRGDKEGRREDDTLKKEDERKTKGTENEEKSEDVPVSISESSVTRQPAKSYRTEESSERTSASGQKAFEAVTLPSIVTLPAPSSSTQEPDKQPVVTLQPVDNENDDELVPAAPSPDESTKFIDLPLPALFPDIAVASNEVENAQDDKDKEEDSEEVTGLVLNLRPRTTTPDPLWAIVLTASPEDNDIENSEPDKTNNTSNIIQDGRIFADTSNSGVVKAKVVEDTNFLARSIREQASIGVPAIISIVIGVLALLCFSLMVFLAMARRRRQMEAIGAPSSTGYTSTARYSPDTGNSSTITDMKPAYMEELSPNVSSFDLQKTEVVIPMDGHLTIIGSYEEFLDVPTGARPNLLQSLPVSPLASFTEGSVPPTQEMNDPELAFAPSYRPELML